ncbi:MAG: restriction endonuclease subunit S [Actinobacteria bacterium]|nr:restriction endonuclease subunit S [Actinomycetota bacterium]
MMINGGQIDPREEPWASMVLVSPNHIEPDTGRIIGRETARDQSADSGKYVAAAGQILYSKIRPALNKAAIAVEDCLCSADMYAMTPVPEVDVRYALNFILSKLFSDYASSIAMRVKMPKINREELADAPWLLPPLDEQRRIADFLDAETAQIDQVIDKQILLIETLRERATAVSSKVLGPAVGSGRRLKWYVDAVDERAGERWRDLPLLSVSISWGVRPRSEISDDEPRSDDLSTYKVVNRGDIVVNRMRAFQGALGVAPQPGLTSPDYLVLRTHENLASGWLAAIMRTPAFVSEMASRVRGIGNIESGSVRTPRINFSDLVDIEIDAPGLDEQKASVDLFRNETSRIDALIQKAEHFVVLAKERRGALVAAAVTGQIDVQGAA